MLKSGLARMDLVTREEFDVQQAVLARTRQQLEALEKRLDAIGTGGTEARKPAATWKGTRKKSTTAGTKKRKKKKAAKKDP